MKRDLDWRALGDSVIEPDEPDTAAIISQHMLQRHLRLRRELARREREACALYEPMPNQLAFHQSQARERLARGSNRGAKTLCAAMELAYTVLRCHPYRENKEFGRIIVVGDKESHLGDVMWNKLTVPQTKFRMIRDKATDVWRAYRPWDDRKEWFGLFGDRSRFAESRPVPPLIPHRFLPDKNIAWHAKNMNVPAKAQLTTGWELMFFTGLGKPPQGVDVDGCWFDEEITNSMWYPEMAARLLDRKGWFIWSATAQAGGQALWDLHVRAEEAIGEENPTVEEFFFPLSDNPYIDEAEKQLLAEKYKDSPEEYRVRILGEYLISSFRVYQSFSQSVHGTTPFEIPDNWCRYMIVDPGNTFCSALFVTVPPEDWHRDKAMRRKYPDIPESRHVYVYDELYVQNCTAPLFAQHVRRKTYGKVFQAFIIDNHGSARTEMQGLTIRQQFTDAFRLEDVRSRATGPGFIASHDNDVEVGVMAVRIWLNKEMPDGLPELLYFKGDVPNFVRQMQRYHNKRDPGGHVVNKPNQRGEVHLCDALRYAATHGCRYVKPEKTENSTYRRVMSRKKPKVPPSKALVLSAGGK